MPIENCFEEALRSPDPVNSVRSVALRLLAEGQDQEDVIARFENARAQLREANRDAEEDIIMDVMDCLVGWCSPQ
jgi:hypothetical protein